MYKKPLIDKRTVKALFLLNLLTKKSYNKKQIIDEFKKENIKVSKTTIVNYIKKLKANNIPIIAARKNGTDYYHLDKTEFSLDISILEVFCANDVKKLLVREKNLDNILTAMKLFYKFALLTSDKETRGYLCDFGYFSKINWTLFNELMQHCKNKDIVELEYLLPKGGCKNINFHTDTIYLNKHSERLYLKGTFEFADRFSILPIDNIFMVKRVVQPYVRFDFETDILTYKISSKLKNEYVLDKNELMAGCENNMAIIKRPIDDEFKIIQKLLSFCPDLYYISDPDIKAKVEEKLHTLKDIYENRKHR